MTGCKEVIMCKYCKLCYSEFFQDTGKYYFCTRLADAYTNKLLRVNENDFCSFGEKWEDE